MTEPRAWERPRSYRVDTPPSTAAIGKGLADRIRQYWPPVHLLLSAGRDTVQREDPTGVSTRAWSSSRNEL